MDKKQKQLILLGILILVLVFAVVNAVSSINKSLAKAKKTQQRLEAAKTKTAPPPVVPGAKTPPASGAPAAQTGQQSPWGVDPFSGRPIYMETGQATELKLSGIVYNEMAPETSYAIINNEIVSAGDPVTGTELKVKKINKDEVTVSNGQKDILLKVW